MSAPSSEDERDTEKPSQVDQLVEELLQDPAEREKLVRRLGLTAGENRTTLSGKSGSPSDSSTLSGKKGGRESSEERTREQPSFWWPPPAPPSGFPPYGFGFPPAPPPHHFLPPGQSTSAIWPHHYYLSQVLTCLSRVGPPLQYNSIRGAGTGGGQG